MKIKFIFFSLLLFNFANSQLISGKIISNEKNQVIPYARIGVENENIGALTDENGNYSIDLSNIDQSKKIIVQLGGYNSFEQNIKDFIHSNNHTIILKEKVNEIAELKIVPKAFENKNIGVKSKAKKMLYGFSSNGSSQTAYREFAIPFSNKKRLKIEKIHLNIAKFKTDKPIVLNFNIYSNKNKQPGESILLENLTTELTADKIIDGTFTFDLNDYSVWIDKEDFYVSVQVMSGFKGDFGFSAALLRTVFERTFYSNWEKIIAGSPAINIDVRIEKEKRSAT
ncbi:carboxypeptidase-like regulatory domain-containing protein [Chryseobacterium timonianum]|uniref:carboxypeptidase-like regulatory domain-containing protein n=1 Tax=Chryseobacterium timonianum TaxID=1805473 RepID=UPI000839FC95|nr:carboxypeptidase-like regulatory domain-containing protein [Chryseobacterium timonianum]